jgi:hypothetical protein
MFRGTDPKRRYLSIKNITRGLKAKAQYLLTLGFLLILIGIAIFFAGPDSVTLDYGRAFFGLKLTLAGFLLVIATTLMGNPIFFDITSLIRIFVTIFPGMEKTGSNAEFDRDARYSAKIAVGVLAAFTTLWIIGLLFSTQIVVPTECTYVTSPFPVGYDWAFRLNFLLLYVLMASWLTLLCERLLSGITMGAVAVFTKKRLKSPSDSKLNVIITRRFFGELKSMTSILVYVVFCILICLGSTILDSLQFPVILTAISVASLAIGRSYFIALREAGKERGFSFSKTYRLDNSRTALSWVFGIIRMFVVVVIWRSLLLTSLPQVAAYLSSSRGLLAAASHNASFVLEHSITDVSDSIIALVSTFISSTMLYCLFACAMFGALYSYVLPLYFVSGPTKAIKTLVLGLMVISVSVVVQQFVSAFAPVSSNVWISGVIVLVVSGITKFLDNNVEKVLRPRS